MPTPDATPYTAWPRHLQESWGDCTARGEVDAHNPPASIVEAYLQVAEARARRVAGIPWGDGTQHDLADDEEVLLGAAYGRKLGACPALRATGAVPGSFRHKTRWFPHLMTGFVDLCRHLASSRSL